MSRSIDVAIVGGGLAGGLLARRLKRTRPDVDFVLFESGKTLGGDHTWSFHETDVSPEDLALLDDWVVGRWPSYRVRFPSLQRTLGSGYFSMRSSAFHEALATELGTCVRYETKIKTLSPSSITLDSGEQVPAACVIDARGFPAEQMGRAGYQKFVGLDVELSEPHGLTSPLVMDATVVQSDGFRFVYVLPWGDRRVLIEDTYYSGSPELDVEDIKAEIQFYAVKNGWNISKVHHVEVGCLPIPLDVPEVNRSAVPALGVRGGFFNLTTGYSVPAACESTSIIAKVPKLSSQAVCEALAPFAKRHASQARFYAMLNKMLFMASDPEQRYRVLERFYRLPEPLVQRFYRGSLKWSDCARILIGKPPVPIGRAVQSLWGSREVL